MDIIIYRWRRKSSNFILKLIKFITPQIRHTHNTITSKKLLRFGKDLLLFNYLLVVLYFVVRNRNYFVKMYYLIFIQYGRHTDTTHTSLWQTEREREQRAHEKADNVTLTPIHTFLYINITQFSCVFVRTHTHKSSSSMRQQEQST